DSTGTSKYRGQPPGSPRSPLQARHAGGRSGPEEQSSRLRTAAPHGRNSTTASLDTSTPSRFRDQIPGTSSAPAERSSGPRTAGLHSSRLRRTSVSISIRSASSTPSPDGPAADRASSSRQPTEEIPGTDKA